jgi:hypothetical protein
MKLLEITYNIQLSEKDLSELTDLLAILESDITQSSETKSNVIRYLNFLSNL